MKRIIALAAILSAAVAGGGQAQAASSADRRIAALERQVAVLTRALDAARSPTAVDPRVAGLQKRVTALEKRVTAAEKTVTRLSNVAGGTLVYAQCFVAATADAFVGTWNVVDQIAQATQGGKVYLGPQAAVNDFTSCADLKITRQQTVPPNVSAFSALTALIGQ